MAILGLTDAPILTIENESLGMLEYVTALSDFIRDCQTPLTISFQGDWGSGKTSMMNMVRGTFKKSQIETRWFNTWQFAQFQMQDEIAISLLTAFLDELGESGQKARGIASAVGRMATKQLGRFVKAGTELTLGFGGDETKGAMDKIHDFIAGSSDSAKQLTNLKEEIRLAVEQLLKKSNSERMVVFIDDLDRLVPMRAVEILETIKLFLDVPKCVFVLAVDYHVVSKGLEAKFGVGMGDLKGKSFFDKIIQLPFNLPVAQYNIRKYVKTLFGGTLFSADDDLEILVQLAEFSVGTNPRSLKRLFNTLQLLLIVAKNKSLLETDSIATEKERQRILFAVLCLQLAYEPVYSMLLKDIGKSLISTEYFDILSDAAKLQENSGMLASVTKALPPGHDPIEALERFTSFTNAFKDSLQLESDKSDENQEAISEAEVDLLRQFLFLSSLTSTIGAGVNMPGTFRHKAALLMFIENTLKPKYQVSLAKMMSSVNTEFREHEAYVGFNFELGELTFGVWIGWHDDRGLSASIREVTGGNKQVVSKWFNSNLPNVVKFRHLKNIEYGVIESLAFEIGDSRDEIQQLKDYQSMIDRTMELSLPKLVLLYVAKQAEVEKLYSFADKLLDRLSTIFPSNDGWQVDSQLESLQKGALVKIHHSEWSNKFCLAIASDSTMLRSLYFGIYRVQYGRKYGNGEKSFFSNNIAALFQNEKPNTQEGNDWWVFWKYFSPKIGTPFTGELSQPGAKFAFDTPEDETEAIESIVEVMSRFKKLPAELKSLAELAEA